MPAKIPLSVRAKMKNIRASASSEATTASRVVVNLPFALHSCATAIVAAGAVAEARPPKSTAMTSPCSGEKPNHSESRKNPMLTNKNAKDASKNVIARICFPIPLSVV